MSPEQLRGKPIDRRSDIYALGLMTYEMLTGSLPFQGNTQQEMVIARLRNEPTPLRQIRPDLDFPESVETVLKTAMQRRAEDRYQTTLEFADAFDEAVAERYPWKLNQVADKLLGEIVWTMDDSIDRPTVGRSRSR